MVAFHCSSQTKEGSKIAIQIAQPVEVDHHPHQNHDHASTDFYLAQVRLEPPEHPAHLVETEAEEQKWKSHPERVEQQQHDALSKCRGSSGQAENGAEKEADTRRPANGKNHSNQQRGRITGMCRAKCKTLLPVEKWQLQHSRQV